MKRAIALASALVTLMLAAGDEASAQTYSMSPVRQDGASVTFRLKGIPAHAITSARLVRRRGAGRELDVRRVRIAARRGYLRVNTRSHAYRGLRVLRARHPRRAARRGRALRGWKLRLHVDGESAPSGATLLSDPFTGADGWITGHEDFWSNRPLGTRDPNWGVESGDWQRRNGTAWTRSSIFRAWTKRRDFLNVQVEFDLKNNGFTNERGNYAWNGVKLWLRRKLDTADDPGGPEGYSIDVNLQDRRVYIQKKLEGRHPDATVYSQGGSYYLLASTPKGGLPARIGRWERVGGSIETNRDGSVTLTAIRDGRVVLTYTDRGQRTAWGGPSPVIEERGRIGIRGDSTDFNVDNVTVLPAG